MADHVDLLQLEVQYEAQEAKRRFLFLVVCGVCVFFAVVMAQCWLIYGLHRAGVSLHWILGSLMAVWSGAGVYVYRRWALRESRAGEPFEGSRNEFKRSIQWIQGHFS